ncbi:MAG: glycosyltransferase family 9 protein, partial [bacterium]
IRGIHQKARQLKEMEFDMVISPHRSARTAIILAMAGIERRIGFASSDLPWLYHQQVPRDEGKHEVLRNLDLLGPLGGIPPGFEPELILPKIGPPDPEVLGADDGKLKVAISPGSEWRTKRWHPEGFARAGRILMQEQAAELYLLGMEQDTEVAAEVEEFLKGEVINLTGKLSREALNRTLAAMNLLITNDSAPAHIASALKVPVVAVFGPTVPEQGFSPWQNWSRVAEVKGLPCRPCGKHGAARCPEGHFKCMELLKAEEVAAQAAELL